MKFRGSRRIRAVKSVACVAVAAGLFGSVPSAGRAFAAAPDTVAVAAIDTSAYEGVWVIAADPDATAERGGRLDFEEYFAIESGVVTPQELSKLGFEPKAATFTTAADGSVSWTVTLTSGSQGVLTITGAKAGPKMIGTITWDRGGQTYVYAYSGTATTPASGPS